MSLIALADLRSLLAPAATASVSDEMTRALDPPRTASRVPAAPDAAIATGIAETLPEGSSITLSVAGRVVAAFENAFEHPPSSTQDSSSASPPPGRGLQPTLSEPIALPAWMPQALSTLFIESQDESPRRAPAGAPARLARARLRLHSRVLGDIDIDVCAQGDRITVDFATHRASAQAAIRNGRPQLDTALAGRGLRLAHVEVLNGH